ncbi:Ig-like domain-containing protein [Mycolicibacterium hodleri]|uniref:Ig-like domain-containing protein n=1 Tax=Mycolicibacterium hodleri TaxID=49897 RepID=UPI001375E798|nr:Ig-like domain-containing protein [Mycolicibacterium hodleri]
MAEPTAIRHSATTVAESQPASAPTVATGSAVVSTPDRAEPTVRTAAPGMVTAVPLAVGPGTDSPTAPAALPPLESVALAFVRREKTQAATTVTGTAVPELTVRASPNPITGRVGGLAALFRNSSPTLHPTQTGQSAAGVVSGELNAADPDSADLTFSVAQVPAHGSVVVDADGSYSYTPDPAVSATGTTDSFRVSVSDASSGFHIHRRAGLIKLLTFGLIGADGHTSTAVVPVTVAPFTPGNTAPIGSATVGSPDPRTGVVHGTVVGTDADGDSLTYSGSATTTKGSVTVTAGGAFTYAPTVVARHNAAALAGTVADRTDTFAVTLSDGRGGTVVVPVTIAIGPVNAAPTGSYGVGAPDAGTGAVSGAVVGTDGDGDLLTYSGPGTTAKGSVSINASSGAFSFIPTSAARTNAAAPGATTADRQDTFSVSIADGHGGTAAVAVTVPISAAATPSSPLPAFDGAEGFGAYATGGRGGSVVYVTNLNADGAGSLQWAIDQPGAKYILFNVSGLIDSQIHLTNGNATIAGQTSPGGITIRGFVTDETPYQDQDVHAPADFAENWILQHVRIRPGLTGPSDDGLRLRYTRNAIVDHVSIGNAIDEAVEISYSHDITVQNTIIAETVGGHSFYGGILMNYSNPAYGFGLDNVSLHHNVFNRIEGRLPEGSRESLAAANSFMNLELSNNLYWDPRFFIALGPNTGVATNGSGNPYPIYWKINAVNNYFQTGPTFPYGMFDDQIMRTPLNQLYVSGNRMSLYPTRSDYQLFYCCNDYSSVTDPDTSSQAAQKLTSRHPFPAITYTPTDMLRTVLLNTAGAWPRDPMDIRLLQSVATNTISAAPPNTNPAGDALLPPYTGAAPSAPVDTDADGMPDAWEIAKGLDPNVPNHNATDLSPQGYTDLEVYLHELSASRVTGWA